MNSERCYKICKCSVILAKATWVSSKLLGLQYYLPENFRKNLVFTKVRIFLIPLSIELLNPTILGFLFTTKNRLTWRMKCENRREFTKIFTWMEQSAGNFVSRQYLLLGTDILQKIVVGCPFLHFSEVWKNGIVWQSQDTMSHFSP